MARDMKETIAQAAIELITEDKAKKLTVKDIVDKCHITRQSFYYHFEDIPDLLRWVLEQGIEHYSKNRPENFGTEEEFRYLFMLALNIMPYIKWAMESNYAQEIERLLDEQLCYIFERMVRENDLYHGLSEEELDIVRRYNSRAVLGILSGWSAEDEKNSDLIIHTVYRLIQGDISPNA